MLIDTITNKSSWQQKNSLLFFSKTTKLIKSLRWISDCSVRHRTGGFGCCAAAEGSGQHRAAVSVGWCSVSLRCPDTLPGGSSPPGARGRTCLWELSDRSGCGNSGGKEETLFPKSVVRVDFQYLFHLHMETWGHGWLCHFVIYKQSPNSYKKTPCQGAGFFICLFILFFFYCCDL